MYKWNLGNYPLPKQLRARMAPTSSTTILYRIGGIVFMILGLIIGILALIGVIRPQ